MSYNYTKEQETFIQSNADLYTRKDLCRLFNEKFKAEITYSGMTQKCINMGCTKKIEKVSEEQIQYLIDNFELKTWRELTESLNLKFGTHYNSKSLNRILYQRNRIKFYRHCYTKEQKEFLMKNVCRYSYPELTEKFNESFKASCTQQSIQHQCIMVLNVKRGDNYKPHNEVAIGSEARKYKSTKYSTVYLKVKGGLKTRRAEMWKPKHHVIWEQNNRPIKADETIVFLDKNKENFKSNNLYCVPKKIVSVMNLNKWFTNSAEHNLAAIKWCELHYAIKKERTATNKELIKTL